MLKHIPNEIVPQKKLKTRRKWRWNELNGTQSHSLFKTGLDGLQANTCKFSCYTQPTLSCIKLSKQWVKEPEQVTVSHETGKTFMLRPKGRKDKGNYRAVLRMI